MAKFIYTNAFAFEGDERVQYTKKLLDDVRQKQQAAGDLVTGQALIGNSARIAIREAAEELKESLSAHGLPSKDAIFALERAEEMFRRQQIYVEPRDHVSFLAYLVDEISANALALNTSPSKVVRLSVFNGAIAEALRAEHPELSWIVASICINSTFNPKKRLDEIQTRFDALKTKRQEPGCLFANFRKSSLLDAVLYADPEERLNQLGRKINELVEQSQSPDNEFYCFRNTPGVFYDAVIQSDFERLYVLKEKAQRMFEESRHDDSPFQKFDDLDFFVRAQELGKTRLQRQMRELRKACRRNRGGLCDFQNDSFALTFLAVYHSSDAVASLEKANDLYQSLKDASALDAVADEELRRLAVLHFGDAEAKSPQVILQESEPSLGDPFRPKGVTAGKAFGYQFHNDV